MDSPLSLSANSGYLGTGEGPEVAPAVVRVGNGFAVAYVDSRGVSLATPSNAALIFDGATQVAACRLAEQVVVATFDGDGVRARIGEKTVTLSQRPDAHALRVAACGTNLLALFLVADGLVVVRYDPRTDGLKEVTHRLREEPRELDLASTASRVAVAVGYGSDHVDLAVLNVDGVAGVRVHPVLRGGEILTHPRVSWVRTGFVVSAWEPSTMQARMARDGQELDPFVEVESPFEIQAFGDTLYCVEVLQSVGEAALRLHVRGPELNTRRTPVPIEPAARKVRQRQRRGRDFMRVLAAKQVAHGYRGSVAGAVDVDAMSGELYGQAQPITYSIVTKERVHLTVNIGELGEEESTSMWRLATWVRHRWSPSSRARAAADLAWATAVTNQEVLAVDRSPGMLRVQLNMDTYPDPDAFMEWLRELGRGPSPEGD